MSSVQEPGSARSARLEAERAFQALDLHRALQHYSTAIELEPADAEYVHVCHSPPASICISEMRESAPERKMSLLRRCTILCAGCGRCEQHATACLGPGHPPSMILKKLLSCSHAPAHTRGSPRPGCSWETTAARFRH